MKKVKNKRMKEEREKKGKRGRLKERRKEGFKRTTNTKKRKIKRNIGKKIRRREHVR